MLGLFDVIRDKFKSKPNKPCIDNSIFKLHYRATSIIFCIATILVTSREYIGEHIRCINDMRDPGFERVIETFCFFTTTFTVIDTQDFARQNYGPFGQLGNVYDSGGAKRPIRKHMYYQWVPFLLFGQAIMFYLPHILWKKLEDNRIHKLVTGLNYSRFALLEKEQEVDDQTIPSKEKKQVCILRIKTDFLKRVALNKSWAWWFVLFEHLNVGHVLLQFYITDAFLGKQFMFLGTRFAENGTKVLDEVFPKVTKCTFHKYGPSGSIQVHDALCVMALNIVNEKIYLFLWFWFSILLVASVAAVVWRFLTMVLYSRCTVFNQFVLGHTLQGKLYPWHVKMVVQQCKYPDWLFLKYLSKNMDGLAFRELFLTISEDLEERKPLMLGARKIGFEGLEKFD